MSIEASYFKKVWKENHRWSSFIIIRDIQNKWFFLIFAVLPWVDSEHI